MHSKIVKVLNRIISSGRTGPVVYQHWIINSMKCIYCVVISVQHTVYVLFVVRHCVTVRFYVCDFNFDRRIQHWIHRWWKAVPCSFHINNLVLAYSNFIDNALELLQAYTNTSIWGIIYSMAISTPGTQTMYHSGQWSMREYPIKHTQAFASHSWWRHQIEGFSALLVLCAGIHWSPVNYPHKGQWHGALICALICALNKV